MASKNGKRPQRDAFDRKSNRSGCGGKNPKQLTRSATCYTCNAETHQVWNHAKCSWECGTGTKKHDPTKKTAKNLAVRKSSAGALTRTSAGTTAAGHKHR